jgi:hypothetical protein
LDFVRTFLGRALRNVEGMKSQLMTALSIVGVLGTATTAMAVNTDALATLDPGAIGTATDTLLPGTAAPVDPAAPVATPAPADPNASPTPTTSSAPQTGGNVSGSNPRTNSGSAPAAQEPQAPAVQQPQAAPVNGTSGGSGSRVDPATGAVVNYEDDEDEDHDEDGEHEDEHEEEDDD